MADNNKQKQTIQEAVRLAYENKEKIDGYEGDDASKHLSADKVSYSPENSAFITSSCTDVNQAINTIDSYVESEKQNKAVSIAGITATTVNSALKELSDRDNGKYTKPAGGIPITDLSSSVQKSLNKADSLSKPRITLESGTGNGTLKLKVDENTQDNIAVTGLKSAAYTESDAYATAEQGTKADNALPKTDFESFRTANSAAIADARKAGTDATESLNGYKTTNDAKVSENASAISVLQESMKSGITFKGKLDNLPDASAYDNGDLIIVGTKEYICLATTDSGNTTKSWVELGDEGTHLTKATADGYYVAKNAAIAAGTGAKISYDSKGLVTGSTGLSASDIPDLDAAKIVSGTLPDARIESAETWNNKQDRTISIAGITATTVDNALKELSEEIAKKGDSGKSLFLSSDEAFTSYTLVDNTDMAFTTALTASPTVTIPPDFTGCIAGVEFINKESATSLSIVNNSGIAFAKFRTIVNGTDRTSSRLAKTDDTHYSLTISKNSTIQSVFKATALGLDIDIREMDYKEES